MPKPSTTPADQSGELRFTAAERIPTPEILARLARCRALLQDMHPEAGGLLINAKPHLYYLTGTAGAGQLWLPRSGEPVLMLRKGCARAGLESPLRNIRPFVSYREIPALAADAGSPLTEVVAVDKDAFSWTMADMLTRRLPKISFVAGDDVLARARAVKTAWEQERMRECGRIHARLLDEVLPARLAVGMKESDIALIYVQESLALGSDGLCRMRAHGEEMLFGYASCGNNGLYPTAYNGPLGCRGLHPATPFLGSRDVVWEQDQCLSVDMACQKGGYNTDRTQTYWSGSRAGVPTAVDRAQKACAEILDATLEILKPGVTPAFLWKKACEHAARLGFADTFMGLGPDRVPFLGHGIGLSLDEWPAIARSFNEPVEAGMALALEPKIAVPGFGMPGVEHTYLVQQDGPEPLTGTQKDLICLE